MGSNRFSRSVSIIGVGLTPFFKTEGERYNMSEGELFAYAAREAFNDCGVNPRDIGHYYFGNTMPNLNLAQTVPSGIIQDWAGLRGIGGTYHAEGCATGYYALDLAVKDVASGAHDIVLTGCAEFADTYTDRSNDTPGYARRVSPMDELLGVVNAIYDKLYTQGNFCWSAVFDQDSAQYALENNLTDEEVFQVMCHILMSGRRAAEINPKAVCYQYPLAQQAKEAGFDDVIEFLRSPIHNPETGGYSRSLFLANPACGGGVLIVCPTEMAHEFTDKPVEIYTMECSTMEAMQPNFERQATQIAMDLIRKNSDVKSEDIDLLYCNDFVFGSELVGPEVCGYIPEGEVWKYIIDGRTEYDGDKPVNPNGGRCGCVHAYSVSGVADIYDAVKQMRGEAGEHQVKKLPKTTMIRGFGGGQNVSIQVLKSLF